MPPRGGYRLRCAKSIFLNTARASPHRPRPRWSGPVLARVDRIYQQMMVWIYRCATRLCSQEDDAKDHVQDTFLNAIRRLKYYLIHPNLTLFLPRRKARRPSHKPWSQWEAIQEAGIEPELSHTVRVSAPPENGRYIRPLRDAEPRATESSRTGTR